MRWAERLAGKGRARGWVPVFLLCAALALLAAAPARAAVVAHTEWRGAISPAAAAHFSHALNLARERQAALLVLQLDTPGGLDSAMRDMIRDLLASPVPVAVWVAPSGARAASAGTYLLYAAHVAAMAPGTNLGAATPVPVGIGGPEPARREPGKDEGGADKPDADKAPAAAKERPAAPADAMRAKQVNDAAAYLRSFAQMRGRNADWAEAAVRRGESLSAEDALKAGVVDLLAPDLAGLLYALDGRAVKLDEGERRLALAGASVVTIERGWKNRLLAAIADPNVALILLMIGFYGLVLEVNAPGFGAGVVGAISLLLGFYGLQLLPINYVGLALIALGVGLMVAEAFMPSFGVLGAGGIAAFVAGGFMLVDEVPGIEISAWVLVPLAAFSAALLFAAVALALRARHRPLVSGDEALLGETALALEDFAAEGWVQVHGERWRARSREPVARGQKLRVAAREGLVLRVQAQDRERGGP